MDWNDGQKEVLKLYGKDHNILVSAAAGSGKTAVLVERIVRSVEQGYCGIDEILVVTFTNAAAAQMKGKITRLLEERTYESGNPRMLRQLSLVANADISTIDSFCNRVVRENFQMAGVDPGFGILDKGEEALLQEDVLDSVLDQLYLDAEFSAFARAFIRKSYKDDILREIILKIYTISNSFADPEAWLSGSTFDPDAEDTYAAGMASPWVSAFLAMVKKKAEQDISWFDKMIAAFSAEPDPEKREAAAKIVSVFQKDKDYLNSIKNATTLLTAAEQAKEKAASFDKKKYSNVYPAEQMEELGKIRLEMRKGAKEMLKGVSEEELRLEFSCHAVIFRHLLRAVRLFREALLMEKKHRKKYSFSDIAHMAFRVLYDSEKGTVTPVGRRYSEKYRYIYIDEYQDSTDMQEHILNSVARFKDGVPANVFMVGDVKQSIYRFRQARPRLFLEKVDIYGPGKREGEVLFLNENYRSRKEILEGVNYVFRQIMQADFGGIVYDENAQLNHPKKELLSDPDWLPEVLVCDASEEKEPVQNGDENAPDPEAGDEVSEKSPSEAKERISEESSSETEGKNDLPPVSEEVLEARMIGRKILSLVRGGNPMMIPNESYDKEKPESETNFRLRPVTFGDVVILQRSVSGCGKMLREFEKMGIPVQLEDPKAYFDAEEVVILLSLLNLIDNSRQDIPYAAVLHSPIAKVTDEELAFLATRRLTTAESLFDTAEKWIRKEQYKGKQKEEQKEKQKEEQKEELKRENEEEQDTEYFKALRKSLLTKLTRLHEMLNVWKKECKYLSISQLIRRILEDTGFREAAAKMPQGVRRLKNISQMIYKAEVFEGSGDSGLFTFLRYIDKCKVHEADFADRGGASEGVNAVRICTIHSSKGLEYPVVFVSRLGKKFNRKSYQKKIIVSADFGIAPQRIRKIAGKYWLSEKGIQWNAVKQLDIQEGLYDEERLLYVAMTRAKEKLFLTGVRKGFASLLREALLSGGLCEVMYGQLAEAESYFDFLLPALMSDIAETGKYYKIEAHTAEELTREENAEDGSPAEEKPVYENTALENAEEGYVEAEKSTEENAAEERAAEVRAEEERTSEEKTSEEKTSDHLNGEESEMLTPEKLRSMYNFRYPYQGAVETKAKLTVSEVKEKAEKLALAEAGLDTAGEAGGSENETEKKKTGSIRRNRKKVSGSEYGTAVHKLMELLPIRDIENAADMKKALEELLESSFFTDDLRKAVRVPAVSRFYSASPDSLFQRMKRAEEKGLLHREKQFLIGIPAYRVGVDLPLAEAGEDDLRFGDEESSYPVVKKGNAYDTEETIVLQGVIDAFFLEEDEDGNLYAVVVDYKTDHVDTPEELILRYKTQLILYSDTIADILGIPVREMWLYGFNKGLGEIRL